MDETPDKPEGAEQHPADENPERQGPGGPPPAEDESGGDEATGNEPRPEASPGEPGVTSPKQGRV
jgi:hypothetical protein